MNQHIKTWVGAAVIVIIAITAGVFVWLSQKNNPIETEVERMTVNKTAKNSQATKAGDKTGAAQSSGDADIDAIEKDLNSVSDDSFGENNLSDSEVGL